MLLLIHIERNQIKAGKPVDRTPIAWVLEGRAFVIRERDELVHNWLPKFFRQGKFQSFTRKLYRWGFRQVNLPKETPQGKSRELIFANPHFQRDRRQLMTHMRSITAAGIRRQQQKTPAGEQGTARPATSLANTSRASDALIQAPPGMMLPHIPATSILPGLDQFAMVGQQNQLAILDSLNRQALLNQQLQQYGQVGVQALLHPQIQQQSQQQLLLSALLSASQSQTSVTNNALLPQVSNPSFANILFGAATERSEGATEQKQAQAGDAGPQERLRRAAELLLGGGQHPPHGGTPGGQGPQAGS